MENNTLPYVKLDFTDRDAWLDWRGSRIGASDIAAALGVSRFQTRLQLIKTKLGMLKKVDTPFMQRGRDLEETVRKILSLRLIDELESVVLQSTEHPFLVAQLDGFSPKHQVEIKVAATERSYLKTVAQIPIDYQYQMQHQMLVSGRECVEFVCFHEACGLSVQTYKRNPEMQQKVLDAAYQLLEDLQSAHQANEKGSMSLQLH